MQHVRKEKQLLRERGGERAPRGRKEEERTHESERRSWSRVSVPQEQIRLTVCVELEGNQSRAQEHGGRISQRARSDYQA